MNLITKPVHFGVTSFELISAEIGVLVVHASITLVRLQTDCSSIATIAKCLVFCQYFIQESDIRNVSYRANTTHGTTRMIPLQSHNSRKTSFTQIHSYTATYVTMSGNRILYVISPVIWKRRIVRQQQFSGAWGNKTTETATIWHCVYDVKLEVNRSETAEIIVSLTPPAHTHTPTPPPTPVFSCDWHWRHYGV